MRVGRIDEAGTGRGRRIGVRGQIVSRNEIAGQREAWGKIAAVFGGGSGGGGGGRRWGDEAGRAGRVVAQLLVTAPITAFSPTGLRRHDRSDNGDRLRLEMDMEERKGKGWTDVLI